MLKKLSFIYIIVFFLCSANAVSGEIVIGVKPDSIVVWRYWEFIKGKMRERMLILNQKETDIQFGLRLIKIVRSGENVQTQVDTNYGTLGGTRLIPARNYTILNAPGIQTTENENYLLAVVVNGEPIPGYMRLHSMKPGTMSPDGTVITTESINGGGEISPCWWEQHASAKRGGERDTVLLHISPSGKQPRSIILPQASSKMLKPKLIKTVADGCTIRTSRLGTEFLLPRGRTGDSPELVISFVVEMPLCEDPTMTILPVRENFGTKDATHIDLLLLAVP